MFAYEIVRKGSFGWRETLFFIEASNYQEAAERAKDRIGNLFDIYIYKVSR